MTFVRVWDRSESAAKRHPAFFYAPSIMPSHDTLFCWSCQCGLTHDVTVQLGELLIPCCTKCWSELTVEQRLKVGQMFADRADGGVIDATTTLFRSAFGRFIEESGGDQWFRGRGN